MHKYNSRPQHLPHSRFFFSFTIINSSYIHVLADIVKNIQPKRPDTRIQNIEECYPSFCEEVALLLYTKPGKGGAVVTKITKTKYVSVCKYECLCDRKKGFLPAFILAFLNSQSFLLTSCVYLCEIYWTLCKCWYNHSFCEIYSYFLFPSFSLFIVFFLSSSERNCSLLFFAFFSFLWYPFTFTGLSSISCSQNIFDTQTTQDFWDTLIPRFWLG